MANVATVHILNHLCVHWIALPLAKDDQVEVVQLVDVADSQEQILESLSKEGLIIPVGYLQTIRGIDNH